ncbi:uncharacterized protein METZ01_LOCUS181424 [marine metagenome]|uniref:Uncharacterized protein n=1 Tax=marine metagenome TaxID=408172 RepID=A0A382CR08_9ZZZZ
MAIMISIVYRVASYFDAPQSPPIQSINSCN